MIAYGAAIASEEKFERYAKRGIDLVSGPETRLDRAARAELHLRRLQRDHGRGRRGSADRGAGADPRGHRDPRPPLRGEAPLGRSTIPTWRSSARSGRSGSRASTGGSTTTGIGSSILEPIDAAELYETPLLEGSEMSGTGGFGDVDMVDGYLLGMSRWAIHGAALRRARGRPGLPRLRRRHLLPGPRAGSKGLRRRDVGGPPPQQHLAHPLPRATGCGPRSPSGASGSAAAC